MPLLPRLTSIWRNLFDRDRVERELTEEVRAYLELLIEAKMKEGLDPDEARRSALIELGGVEQVKESVREVRMGHFLEILWQDLRYGARMLLKRAGFTSIAVLTLALGIGANTAIFGFINSLFLRPLPVANADRVVRLYAEGTDGRRFDTLSYPNYADLRDHSESFDGLAAHQYTAASLNLGAGAENIHGELVTGNYFDVLEASAAMGRSLQPEDDIASGAHPVVVVSHRLWKSRFGSSPDILGMKVYINGHPFTVVGVMPEKFRGTYEAFVADFWAPMMMQEQIRPRGLKLDRRGWGWLNATGRLKSNTSLEQAQAEIDQLAGRLERDYPQFNQGLKFNVLPASALPEEYNQAASGLLKYFIAVVSLVLLVACANIANILLSRVMARRQEIAIRQSLGATRSRLVRQWLAESVLLALLGGAAGLLVAGWVSDGLMMLVPPELAEFSPSLRQDGRVLAFGFFVSLLTGVLCGLFPALRAGKMDMASVLKEEGSSSSGSAHRSRLQQVFVVAQVSVSVVLLIVAGLLLRSLRQTASFDPGFNSSNLSLATLALSRNGYSETQGRAFYRQLTERLKSLPGVQAVTFATVVPLGTSRETLGFVIPGHEPPAGRTTFPIANNVIGPDYFVTMGIPIMRGRGFDQRDAEAGAKPAVVINETMAQRFWPGLDPIGQSIRVGPKGPFVEIIGVARDIKYYSLGEEPRPYIYGSFAQFYASDMTLHLRADGDPRFWLRTVQKEVEALDPNISISELTTLAELRLVPLFPSRAMAIVSSLFGLLTLILAALGIYGVVSYSVNQRKREIGIRMALGAQAADIFRMIVRYGLALTLVGIGVGLAASLALTRFLSSLLFGVSATDPLTFAGISVILAGVALAACYVPARRAMKVDPMVALRYE